MSRSRISKVLVAVSVGGSALVVPGGSASAAPTPAIPYDVDGNGFGDLVIGAPGEDIGSRADAGMVIVVRTPGGTVSRSASRWHQDSAGIGGAAEPGDGFGTSLASGDFDADGFADLAVGVPGEDIGATQSVGGVQVIYGSRGGLSTRDQWWTQDSPGIPDADEAGDGWGTAVAAGDVDGDGYADLAVGAPLEDLDAKPDVGAVHVIYGSGSGLTAARSSMWHQDVPGISEDADVMDPDEETDVHRGWDKFGAAVAIGDTTGDGIAELAIGVPMESVEEEFDPNVGPVVGGGAVHLLLGRAGGITAEGEQYWTQNSPGVLDRAELGYDFLDPKPGDLFGFSLAIGDIDADGRGDLAVGIPQEEVVGTLEEESSWEGAVAILRGSPDGLTASGNQFLHQNTPGVPGAPRGNDLFGWSVALGDANSDDHADLAVGLPGESTGGEQYEGSKSWGAVIVLRGDGLGISTANAQYWSQNSAGVPGGVEPGDFFGASVALRNVGSTSSADLIVGVPGEDRSAGRVHILYGGGGLITSRGTQTVSQNSPGIPDTAEPGDRSAIVGHGWCPSSKGAGMPSQAGWLCLE